MSPFHRILRVHIIGLLPLVAVAGLALIKPALGQTVKVTASGVINLVSTNPGVLDASVQVGTPFNVNFLYDFGSSNQSSNPEVGAYYYSGPAYGLEGTFGDYTISANAGTSDVAVFNRPSGFSEYQVQLTSFGNILTTSNPNAGPPPTQTQFGLAFTDSTGMVANSISLPPASLFQLSHFDAGSNGAGFSFYYDLGFNQFGAVDGTVTSLSAQTLPQAVPEASTTVSFGLLLALGLGGVVITAKRKKRNA